MYYISKLCFICLNNENLQNILHKSEEDLEKISFVISEITFLESPNSANLFICSLCNSKLQSFYIFKKKGLESYCHNQNSLEVRKNEDTRERKEKKSCFVCLTTEELHKRGHNTLKQISFILPEIIISETKLPIRLCLFCNSDLKYFYSLKKRCLKTYRRWKNFPNKLLKNCNAQLEDKSSELKVLIEKMQSELERELDLTAISLNETVLSLELNTDGTKTIRQYIVTDFIPAEQLQNYKSNQYDINPSNIQSTVSETDNNSTIDENSEENGDVEMLDFVDNSTLKEQSTSGMPSLNSEKPPNDAEKDNLLNCEQNLILPQSLYQKDYKCILCKKEFDMKNSLKNHIALFHLNIAPYKCKYCTSKFKNTNSLRFHENIHRTKKDFKCTVCKKLFLVKSEMILHKKAQHYAQKVFKCETCFRLFTEKSKFNIHLETEKIKCNICSKSFCEISAMKKHKKKIHYIFETTQ